nr:hypothetical protein [Gracilinema caldarium]
MAGIICVDDDAVMTHVDEAVPASPSLRYRAYVRSVHRDAASAPAQGRPVTCEGRRLEWQDFNLAVAAASPHFSRPTGQDATQNTDIMLLYFTSGTTGMPKMVRHDFTYPLGHIVTAKREASTSPWPIPAGPRPPGARFMASGSANARSLSTITTALCPQPCSK